MLFASNCIKSRWTPEAAHLNASLVTSRWTFLSVAPARSTVITKEPALDLCINIISLRSDKVRTWQDLVVCWHLLLVVILQLAAWSLRCWTNPISATFYLILQMLRTCECVGTDFSFRGSEWFTVKAVFLTAGALITQGFGTQFHPTNKFWKYFDTIS